MNLTVSLGRAALLSMVLLLGWTVGPIKAHEIRPSVADIEVGADRVRLTIRATLEPLIGGIDLAEVEDTDDAPNADENDRLRALAPADLEAALRDAWPDISVGITIISNGSVIPLEIISAQIPPVGDVELPRDSEIFLEGQLPPGDAPVILGWRADYGELVLRQVGGGEDAYTGFLTGSALSDPLPRGEIATERAGRVFLRYIVVGFEHIVPKGLDHILFVLGLFFFATKMRPLLFQVTAFTVAHTITLALASLNIVAIPASVVEPMIALSIVYVGVENVLGIGTVRRRTALVFAFGLLHGLGFASVLGNVGIDPARFVTALVGFNIGVEIGQLTVITVAFLAVGLWFRKKPWYRVVIAVPISLLIAATGAWWSIERAFF
jgi:hypothetical protein